MADSTTQDQAPTVSGNTVSSVPGVSSPGVSVDGQIHAYVTDIIRDIENASSKIHDYLQNHVDVNGVEKHLAAIKEELGGVIGLELDKNNDLTPKS